MKKRTIIISLLIFLLTACAPSAPESKIEVLQASVRLLGGDMPAAGYLLIENAGSRDDKLLGVQADFADQAMLHQSSVDANGVVRMRMVMAIDVPAGQQVALKPGSYHIVFEKLKTELHVGDSVTLKLQFEQAGTVSVQAQLTGQ